MTKFSNWDFNIPPRTGIAKGRKARDRVIDRSLAGRTFEDLKIPLCIVAADILTGDQVVFDSGSLADAIRASLACRCWPTPGITRAATWLTAV